MHYYNMHLHQKKKHHTIFFDIYSNNKYTYFSSSQTQIQKWEILIQKIVDFFLTFSHPISSRWTSEHVYTTELLNSSSLMAKNLYTTSIFFLWYEGIGTWFLSIFLFMHFIFCTQSSCTQQKSKRRFINNNKKTNK